MWLELASLVFWLYLYLVALFSSPLGHVLKLKRGIIEAVKYECGHHWLTHLHLFVGIGILFGYVVIMNDVLQKILGEPPYFIGLAIACASTASVILYYDLRPLLEKKIEKKADGELEKGE